MASGPALLIYLGSSLRFEKCVGVDTHGSDVLVVMSDSDIIEEVRSTHEPDYNANVEAEDDGDEEQVQPQAPSIKQTSDALDVVRRFAVSVIESANVDRAVALACSENNH